MNLTTRAQSKSRSPKDDSKASTPKSQKDSPRPSSANRKKSSEIAETKAKRTRTGCLTCRERHLKCDEALGRCLNCRKSDRICRRGVRLNFIDIQTVAPPHIIARPQGTKLTFRDDSRFIASEYVGGFERYPPPQPDSPIQERRQIQHEALNLIGSDQLASLFQSVAHSFDPVGLEISHSVANDFLGGADAWHDGHLVPGDELLPQGTSNFAHKLALKQYSPASLTDPDQIFLLQAFVDEVGPWMDSMDVTRHFTQVLPLHSIDEPLLLKAFLACGARHISLADPNYGQEKAHQYYDAATQDLLHIIQDPNRDSVLCATAALVLSVYESMSPQPNMKHVAGSRALIRECGWSAKTPHLGGACFWLSVSMELLQCLEHGWALSWNPDTWGIDMHMDQVQPLWKGDEHWLHRIIYICAKVATFRVAMQNLYSSVDSPSKNIQLNEAVQEWNHYNAWCEQWASSIPRSMRPIGHVQPWQTESHSRFPKTCLIKRSAIISQFFYHTTRIVLAKAHPMATAHPEMKKVHQSHAYDVCGLAANLKDRSISNIALHCLSVAAESLEIQEAQEEVLHIFDNLTNETQWHAEPIKERLKRLWNWTHHVQTVDPTQMHSEFFELDPALSIGGESGFAASVTNPLLNSGDFSMENNPYQGYYVPPHHHQILEHYSYDSYLV